MDGEIYDMGFGDGAVSLRQRFAQQTGTRLKIVTRRQMDPETESGVGLRRLCPRMHVQLWNY